MLYKLILYAIVVKAIEDYSDYYSDIIEKMTDSGNNTVRRVKVSVNGIIFLLFFLSFPGFFGINKRIPGFEFYNESRFWGFWDLDHGPWAMVHEIPRTLFRMPTPAGYNETLSMISG